MMGLHYRLSDLGFPHGSVAKNPPVVQETEAQSLSQEDPLEKEMATHLSILAWEIPRTEEPGGLHSMGSKELNISQQLNNNNPTIQQLHFREWIQRK